MKRIRNIAAVLLFASCLAIEASHAQIGVTMEQNGNITSTSGTVLTLTNKLGTVSQSFEFVFTGAPSTVSVVTKGCMRGGTCDTLDTYTTVANSIRKPTITAPYDYFTVTPSWTGGVSPTFQVYRSGTIARSGGGGSSTSPLTTKGDIWGFSTVDARIGIGSDNQVLTADASQALGLKWATPTGAVSSVFSRTGAVVAATNDYNFNQLAGSVAASQLPNPSASTLGGVQSKAAVSNQWLNSISTSGVPASSQPNFTDLAGSAAASQMPALTGDATTSAGAVAVSLAANLLKISCERGLGDGLNPIPAGTYLRTTCKNKTGQTITIGGITCRTNNAGTSTMNVTNGAGTALLTGAITCGASDVAGTQSGTTTLAADDVLKFTFVSDGSTLQTDWVMFGTRAR